MGWTLLVAALALALALPAAKPPVILPPQEPAYAWFQEDPRHKVWCAFTNNRDLELFAKRLDAPDHGARGFAYLLAKDGRLTSVVVETTSEDAFTVDWYSLSDQRRFSELRRTGHYIRDDLVTYVFKPDTQGRWAQTAATRELRKSGVTDGFEDYWMDWPSYSQLSDMPFAKLVQFRDGRVSVKVGCTATPTQKKRGK